MGQRSSNSGSLGGSGIAAKLITCIQNLFTIAQGSQKEILEDQYNHLASLVGDLNKSQDAQLKLSNLIKICKVLESNDDQFFFEE